MASLRITAPAAATSWALLVLRLGLGVVMLPHGLQKTLGLFGGPGFGAALQFLSNAAHLPTYVAVLPILAESLGALLLIVGLLTRLAAFAIAVDMLVAALLVHVPNGFFMNWTGQQKGEGFEYHILAIAIGLALVIAGAGRYSLDAAFFGGRRDRR
jgi:putative oxidoreductase